MRIEFERTGGFAGMRVAATIDTETLPPDEARAVREMVGAARFFDLPAKITSPTPGADQFQYRLTVEAEGRKHTVEVGDASAPEALQPLLRRLTLLARSPRGGP
jgi:hypothetical protein